MKSLAGNQGTVLRELRMVNQVLTHCFVFTALRSPLYMYLCIYVKVSRLQFVSVKWFVSFTRTIRHFQP